MAPQEQVSGEEERMASCPPDTAPARSALQVRARGGWGGTWVAAGPPFFPPQNSHCKLAVTTLSALFSQKGRPWAGRCGRGGPVLLASQPENCVMSFCFLRTKPRTSGAGSPGEPGEALLLGRHLSHLPG